MAVRRADLGPASAWAEAVAEGYTGTREDWARALASASTAAQRVEDAAEIVARAVDVDTALQQVDAGLQMVTTWTTGAQMINPAGVVSGKLNSAGTAVGADSTMETTGWIPVQALQEYKVGRWSSGRWGTGTDYVNRWAAYSARDLSAVIGVASSTACTEFTTPEGAAFVRFSYKATYTGLLMAPAESFPEEWEDYGRQYSYAAGIATQEELEQAIADEETGREAADQALWDGIADAEQHVCGLIAGTFNELALYDAGVHCIGPDGYLYRFTAAHSGEWSASDVVRVSVGSELVREDTRITTFGGQVQLLNQQINTRVPAPGTLSAGTYHLVLTVDAQGNKSYTWEAMA